MPRHKYAAYRNMQIMLPELTQTQREKLLQANYQVLSKNITSFFSAEYYTRQQVLSSLDTSDAQEMIGQIQKYSGPTGTLFLIPHLGSFELLAQFWALYDRPISILARDFDLPKFNAWWKSKREINGNHVFPRKGGYASIVSELNRGQNVAVLFDQNVKKSHATFVNFFGTPAATTKSPGIASIRTSCPIILATMVEVSPSKYKLYAYPITRPKDRPETSTEEKINKMIEEAHIYLEKIIRLHPEQWFWIHRRFKTRPKGEAENFYIPEAFPLE